jgi:hypothetical protein
MEIGELEQELREKLPPEHIRVDLEQGVAVYYDFHGVTFREDKTEQAYADGYVVRVISERAGFPVRITEWGPSNNGHFAHYFERMPEDKGG